MNNNVTTGDELTIHKSIDNQIAIADYMKSSAEMGEMIVRNTVEFDNAGTISQTNEIVENGTLEITGFVEFDGNVQFSSEVRQVADAVAAKYLEEVSPAVEPDYEEELETWTPPPYREVIIHSDVQIFADSGEVVPWWHPQYIIRTKQDVKDAFKRLREAEKAILREEADLEIERKAFEAIKANFENRIKPLERKRAYIDMRMSADLKPRLTDLIESGKLKRAKYIDTGYGRYSVSDVPEKIELIEKDLAIDFASLRPDLRHLVEVVHTSKIDVNAAKKLHEMFPEGYWEVHEAEKNGNFKIKTGLR